MTAPKRVTTKERFYQVGYSHGLEGRDPVTNEVRVRTNRRAYLRGFCRGAVVAAREGSNPTGRLA